MSDWHNRPSNTEPDDRLCYHSMPERDTEKVEEASLKCVNNADLWSHLTVGNTYRGWKTRTRFLCENDNGDEMTYYLDRFEESYE